MKIALIATEKLPVPSVRGGAIQIYLEAFAPLIAKKHSVTVFSIKDPSLPETETADGVHYVHLDEEHYAESVGKKLRKGNFDLVHVCNRPSWVTYLKKQAPDAVFVLSVHNEMFAYEKISEREGNECIDAVAQIVTVSDYIGQTITSRFPSARSKTKTVYSGVDLKTYHPRWTKKGQQAREDMRNELGLQGKKIVLFVGRLSKVKGPHILLHALPQIIEQHPDVMMVFIGSKWFGDNDLNNYVKHLHTLGAMQKDHVTFIQFVKPKDIPRLYTMSDVFVCSSQWQEPLARVHYEAMAAGLPIITSNRGGNPEVIEEGKNGYVIREFDKPGHYADLINSLLSSSSKREKLGTYSRTVAENKFGWSRVAENLLSVYETNR
ncbi:glycosyltransferase family 4 protein [Bacillus atrophaeus]|uniref:glycosyltransferase family 4 protein n=1 Tax=Bacillus atrophaeus TaxID=1452 RepID=UPI00227E8B9C|nr:glycosyltransferase family 4 protein [Bacillus atrophaeus]MCY9206778.1 glycosyltransferase family 4 protein [Bacillus atrophaeus]MEC0886309.1 glycosyltransferase family 4 protein [Bacillus atrophaeus]